MGSCQVLQNSASTSYTITFSSKESGNGEIYLTDIEGKSKINVTDRPNNDGYPAWSPDGKRIASYASFRQKDGSWGEAIENLRPKQ